MKIKEMMIKEVKSLTGEELVRDAMEEIFKMRVSGLPVISPEGKLLGKFTEKDILRAVLPTYLKDVGGFVYEENPKNINTKFSALFNLKVKDVMTKALEAVKEDATLCEAAHIMLVNDLRRLPVLNEKDKVVGIVARGDIITRLKKIAESHV